MQANEELPELQPYYNNSLLTIPDGMPLVWYGRCLGYEEVQRTCGLDLLVDLLEISGEKNYSHYFIGSTPETLKIMRDEIGQYFPGASILGMDSPPFRPLSEEEVRTMADTVNRLKPSFVWVGMSAPKQEFLIARLLPLVSSNTIFVGVGLAFSYLAGEVKRSPKMLQKLGLEGVWRLAQQPERLTPKAMWRLLRFIPILLKTKIQKTLFCKR